MEIVKEEKKEVGIHLGALAEPIDKQLRAQKLLYDPKKVEQFQIVADAIVTLRIYEYLPDKVREKMIAKLYKKIIAHICSKNKLKASK